MTAGDTSEEPLADALATLQKMALAFSGDAGSADQFFGASPARRIVTSGSRRIAIVAIGLDDTIRSFPLAAEEMFGYAASEAIGRPASLILDLEPAASLAQRLVARDGSATPHALRGKHRSGAVLVLEGAVEELAIGAEHVLVCGLRDRSVTGNAEAEWL